MIRSYFILFKVKSVRDSYTKIISDKHEDSIAKFGAILAQGIIDAGTYNFFYFLILVQNYYWSEAYQIEFIFLCKHCLSHFMTLASFYTHWKHKTRGFPIFSRGIK